MKTNKAIILCAGMSSRMKKLFEGEELPDFLKDDAMQKPKSMIGLIPLKIKDKNAKIVVRTV